MTGTLATCDDMATRPRRLDTRKQSVVDGIAVPLRVAFLFPPTLFGRKRESTPRTVPTFLVYWHFLALIAFNKVLLHSTSISAYKVQQGNGSLCTYVEVLHMLVNFVLIILIYVLSMERIRVLILALCHK